MLNKIEMEGKPRSWIVISVIIVLLFSICIPVYIGASEVEEESEDKPVNYIYDWHGLNDIRNNLDSNYVLMNDLDENTAGYVDYNVRARDYLVEEDIDYYDPDRGRSVWVEGDMINIWLDEEYYDFFTVTDEDDDPVNHSVEDGMIKLEESPYVRYLYVTYKSASAGWEPIGEYNNSFTGTFRGAGYEIKDLYVNRPGGHGGLFGIITGAEIRNTAVIDANVSGNSHVGALVGSITSEGGIVSNSYSTGEVRGSTSVGGLVGSNWEGRITNSYSKVEIDGFSTVGGLLGFSYNGTVENSYATGDVYGDRNVGGLVGGNYESTVTNSCATGDVSGDIWVGGLVGSNRGSTVTNSYATGVVSGDDRVGGLVGGNYVSTVTNSYATGDVYGDRNVGGLVGYNREGTVSNSYSTGKVSGERRIGGLVGSNRGRVLDSFWDIETSGIEESDGGTGRTTEEMKEITTYTDTETDGLDEPWDFVETTYEENGVWNIDDETRDGYPFLDWQRRNVLTVFIIGNGTVRVEGDMIEDGWTNEYVEDTELTIDAFAEDGYEFVEWTGIDETGEEITVTVDENKVITAVFAEETYDDIILGFVFLSAAIGITIGVIVYHKKKS